MYAILETGGKQYRVSKGDVIFIEKLEAKSKVVFSNVLAVSNGKEMKFGTPYIEGAKVNGKILKTGKGKKITVFTYKPKKDSKRKLGHRQPYSQVKIESIEGVDEIKDLPETTAKQAADSSSKAKTGAKKTAKTAKKTSASAAKKTTGSAKTGSTAAKKAAGAAKKATGTTAAKKTMTTAKKTSTAAAKKSTGTTAKKTTGTAKKATGTTAAKKATTAAKKTSTATTKKATGTAKKATGTTAAKKTGTAAAKKATGTAAKKTTAGSKGKTGASKKTATAKNPASKTTKKKPDNES